eukprot:8090290-Pyramimonas_sp.AAC.1
MAGSLRMAADTSVDSLDTSSVVRRSAQRLITAVLTAAHKLCTAAQELDGSSSKLRNASRTPGYSTHLPCSSSSSSAA